jgi:TPP-dependent pyruvate/acetoin dehydrogenase alpha subunit
MVERRWSDEEGLAAAREAVRKEVDEAVEWAEASPYPDASELTDRGRDWFAGSEKKWKEGRAEANARVRVPRFRQLSGGARGAVSL